MPFPKQQFLIEMFRFEYLSLTYDSIKNGKSKKKTQKQVNLIYLV